MPQTTKRQPVTITTPAGQKVRVVYDEVAPIAVSVGCQTYCFGPKQARALVETIEVWHRTAPNSRLSTSDYAPYPRPFWVQLADDGLLHASQNWRGDADHQRIPWEALKEALLAPSENQGPEHE